jgi:hydrogenase expression/formation protein HypC
MCLSIPARVLSIEGNLAKVSIGGSVTDASLQLVDDVNVGDYVLLHTGFAIEKIDEKEAAETMRLLKELVDFQDNPLNEV